MRGDRGEYQAGRKQMWRFQGLGFRVQGRKQMWRGDKHYREENEEVEEEEEEEAWLS